MATWSLFRSNGKSNPGNPGPAPVPAAQAVLVAEPPATASSGPLTVPEPDPGNRKSLGWKETESLILGRLQQHPCVVDDFEDIIHDRSGRYYKIKRMADQRKARFVGYFRETGGRPRDVYCNGWYPNKLEHEVRFTKVLLPLLKDHPLHIERGPNVDQKYRADADMFFPRGDVWRFEFDTGSQNYRQIEQRWKVYKDTKDWVFVKSSG